MPVKVEGALLVCSLAREKLLGLKSAGSLFAARLATKPLVGSTTLSAPPLPCARLCARGVCGRVAATWAETETLVPCLDLCNLVGALCVRLAAEVWKARGRGPARQLSQNRPSKQPTAAHAAACPGVAPRRQRNERHRLPPSLGLCPAAGAGTAGVVPADRVAQSQLPVRSSSRCHYNSAGGRVRAGRLGDRTAAANCAPAAGALQEVCFMTRRRVCARDGAQLPPSLAAWG
eukprot:363276-Chlamydomonas_euryale.AAC.14